MAEFLAVGAACKAITYSTLLKRNLSQLSVSADRTLFFSSAPLSGNISEEINFINEKGGP